MFEIRGTHLDRATLRRCDQDSIRHFVAMNKDRLTGNVLDYGAGLQPYKDIVSGTYIPYTPAGLASTPAGSPATEPLDKLRYHYDAVICTQVIQYVENPVELFSTLHSLLFVRRGHLLMTYPTAWPEEEASDIYRYTRSGMDRLLWLAGFDVVKHVPRAGIMFSDYALTIGYGVVAVAGKL